MSRNMKISAVLVVLVLAAGAAIAATTTIGGDDAASGTTSSQAGESSPEAASTAATSAPETVAESTPVVASDPRRLGEAGASGVTFTEFLDFECEACGAAFPVIEALREEYGGRVTFNVRYFPIDAHRNARNAAIAVEAAAQQGELEAMYKKMFETQSSWGEQRESKAELFRRFARELGLDMKAYDAAVADPATAARVQRDVEAGLALGVRGTPTFFIDEDRIEPESVDDLRRQLDARIDGS